MHPPIKFEHHLKEKVMEILFPEGYTLSSLDDLENLKKQWSDNLKKWHSPYSCLMDCRKLTVEPSLASDFEKIIAFFSKFFMKKIVGFGLVDSGPYPHIPFPVIATYEEALVALGMGKGTGGLERDLTQLRSRIQIDNDFNAHVMEISFLAPTDFLTRGDIETLKSKIQNILLQWHTPYSIIFNVSNVTFSQEASTAFASVERFLKSFFCQNIVGYGAAPNTGSFPFPMYRARHQAAARLSHQGLGSGDVANCSSKKIFS